MFLFYPKFLIAFSLGYLNIAMLTKLCYDVTMCKLANLTKKMHTTNRQNVKVAVLTYPHLSSSKSMFN